MNLTSWLFFCPFLFRLQILWHDDKSVENIKMTINHIWKYLITVFLLIGTSFVFAQEKASYSIQNTLPIYQEKANAGDIEAQLMLGQIYAMGDIVPADMKQSFSWYMKAAQQNNAEGQCKIAEMYLFGQGVERDLSRAEKWVKLAAQQGYSEAEYLLGFMYSQGNGVPEDWQKATLWLCRAAKQNNVKAIDILNSRQPTNNDVITATGNGVKDWCN